LSSPVNGPESISGSSAILGRQPSAPLSDDSECRELECQGGEIGRRGTGRGTQVADAVLGQLGPRVGGVGRHRQGEKKSAGKPVFAARRSGRCCSQDLRRSATAARPPGGADLAAKERSRSHLRLAWAIAGRNLPADPQPACAASASMARRVSSARIRKSKRIAAGAAGLESEGRGAAKEGLGFGRRQDGRAHPATVASDCRQGRGG